MHEQDQSMDVASLLQSSQASDQRNFSSHTTMTMPHNPALQPSTVINLSNSTDVVIGPMTQYQGPVSIYYMDASMQTAAGINSSAPPNGHNSSSNNSNDNNSSKDKSKRLTRNTLLLSLLVLLVLLTAIVIVYVELSRTHAIEGSGSDNNKSIYFGNSYGDNTFPNLGNGHLVINRNQWGAVRNATNLTRPLKHPIPYVLITHVGVQSTSCFNVYKCSIKMRSNQDAAMAKKGLPDIQSNFYVSGEGNVYVGRGWDWANTYANHSLAVTFLGDYNRYTPDRRQLEAVQYLLAHGVANNILDKNYKLVAQNQTKFTQSPGINVYRIIKEWRHFYHCDYIKGPKCGSELGMQDADWASDQ